MFSRCFFVVLALLLLPSALWAQPAGYAVLKGRVVDAETDEPLPGAHVFVATSTIGTATGSEGHFRLGRVPPGQQRLYVSMVGYEPLARDTLLREGRSYAFAFRLQPAVLDAGALTVTAARDKRWQRRRKKFERRFLGTSENAEETRLLNPEVLRFEDSFWGPLRASAHAPLQIENRALGYRITYFLKEFEATSTTTRWDGEPLFEELMPIDSAEATRWAENRRRAYYGSLRHFLQALLAGGVREEGFRLYRLPPERLSASSGVAFGRASERRLRTGAERLLDGAEAEGQRRLRFRGRLEIIYTGEPESRAFLRWRRRFSERPADRQTSFLTLNDDAVTIDRTGEFVEPYGATQYGYFAFEGLADLVPKDYRPEQPVP